MKDSQTACFRLSGSMMIVRYNPETEFAEFVQGQRGLRVIPHTEGLQAG